MRKTKDYKALYFDMDNTLLSFDQAEREAFFLTARKFHLPKDPAFYQRYREINEGYWRMLENGKITFDELATSRFRDLFEEYGIRKDPARANACYFQELSFQHQPVDGLYDTLEYLKSKGYAMYVTTNGNPASQWHRYIDARLDKYFVTMCVSLEIHAKKPDPEFFAFINEQTGYGPENALVIGDSLASDIKGGIAAGMDTLWISWGRERTDDAVVPTYTLPSLADIRELL